MDFANAFIICLLAGAAILGIAAVVLKHRSRRRAEDERSSNAAS